MSKFGEDVGLDAALHLALVTTGFLIAPLRKPLYLNRAETSLWPENPHRRTTFLLLLLDGGIHPATKDTLPPMVLSTGVFQSSLPGTHRPTTTGAFHESDFASANTSLQPV